MPSPTILTSAPDGAIHLNSYNVVNATDMASSYVTALYFTTSSLTSVGFGNVSGEWRAQLNRATVRPPS